MSTLPEISNPTAVIVPAAKLPLESLCTILLAVFASVAFSVKSKFKGVEVPSNDILPIVVLVSSASLTFIVKALSHPEEVPLEEPDKFVATRDCTFKVPVEGLYFNS